jgi:hypothetical protein
MLQGVSMLLGESYYSFEPQRYNGRLARPNISKEGMK